MMRWDSGAYAGVSPNGLTPFAHQQYLTLETYWKTGTPVATPVWCAEDHGTFYIYTLRSHTPAR
jgi:hypothetical protein